ncbi:hypothetical protein HELRODRAFT_165845 [Helobdella robusta]|uniref:Uncharacterized protein n=1 Tax=Helobdella robusta TaxID=6412 RepID=T1EXD0_HELRO|nr:hypothetical protein HELRODRAFT_165845 [Helobdella robusta]ESN91773.1 hypothetical protein HELRODRAFT_165845 [Helobdella robusta]
MAPKRLKFVSLSQNDEIKVKYNVEIRNRFQLLTEDVNKSKQEIFRDVLTESAREVIPVKEQRRGFIVFHKFYVTAHVIIYFLSRLGVTLVNRSTHFIDREEASIESTD